MPPKICYSLLTLYSYGSNVTCLKEPGAGLPLNILVSQFKTVLIVASDQRDPYNMSQHQREGSRRGRPDYWTARSP